MASPLSVQLYTVRDAMASDLPGTLQRIADIGYREVEPYGFGDRAQEYTDALVAAGLSAPSTHTSLVPLSDDELETLFAAAKKAGIDTLIDPHTEPAQWTTRDAVTAIAARLNEVEKRAAHHGLRIGYHNHDHEISSHIDGVTALEVFADALAPAVVLEVDTYWVEVGGESAAALLGRLGRRVQFLHIKDGPKTKVNEDQVPVGSGDMPIAEILAAAPHALPVVELDAYRGDVFEAVTESRRFLTEELGL